MTGRDQEPADELVRLLRLIQQISESLGARHRRFLRRRGLTAPQFHLLEATLTGQAIHLGDLANQLNCTRGNLTAIIDCLERDGWLVRDRDADDRRIVRLVLTEKGMRVRCIQHDLQQRRNRWSKAISANEAVIIGTLLCRGCKRLNNTGT